MAPTRWLMCAGVCGLLVGGGVPLAADQSCKPVTGHFEAFVVPPGTDHCPPDPQAFCTAGRVWGGIQGNYEFLITAAVPSDAIGAPGAPPSGVPTVLFFTGKSVVSLKNGVQLLGTDTGSIDLPPGRGGFASLITFGAPTDPASAASGQIRLRGQFDPASGTTRGDYTGAICNP